jgi:hypothetical protein
MTINRFKVLYYRDLILGALIALCIVAAIGHILDWRKDRDTRSWQISLAFAIAGAALGLCSPNRVNVLFNCFLTITACGILGAIAGQTLVGLPIVLPSAAIVLVMMRWKGHLLK